MTKNITENINKTGIITKKIISLFIPICLLLISFSLVNCPDPGNDTSTPGNGNGNGNGGGQPDVLPQIIVEYRSAVINKDVTQSGFLLSLKDEPTGDVTVSITVRRSDGSGTATVNLGGSTATATETISFIFTQQNWNIPQEFKLVYGNPIDQDDPDPANVKIILYVTSTADTAYNDLTYYFSGNLTALELPNYSVHVHNARSPEPEDTDAEYTAEGTCTTASGTWDGTACTVDDNRDIKIWFTVDPSVSAATTEVICASAGWTWDSSATTCGVTAENVCNMASGVFTCTITAEKTCTAFGGTWNSGTTTCTYTILNGSTCTTAGGTWDSSATTCSGPITAESACITAGGTWEGCTGTTANACTTAGGTWVSGTSNCAITVEDASTTAANACNTAGGFLDSSSNCISDQKDIMINYEVKAGSAAAGADYIAPTSNTAIIKAGNSGVSISIPLVEDSIINKNDEVDESFSVSITSVSTIGADVSIGDADATVTIGDPNKSAFYFLPNRPLVNGDTPYWECYHLPAEGETFTDIIALVDIFNSMTSTSPQSLTDVNIGDFINGIDVRPYEALYFNSVFLLSSSYTRVAVKFGLYKAKNFSYDSSRDIFDFACYGLKSGGFDPEFKTEGGAFGQLKFGQSYDRAE